MEEKKGYCVRTGRACRGGAYDGGDGWDIDCLSGNPENCPYRKEDKKPISPELGQNPLDFSPSRQGRKGG